MERELRFCGTCIHCEKQEGQMPYCQIATDTVREYVMESLSVSETLLYEPANDCKFWSCRKGDMCYLCKHYVVRDVYTKRGYCSIIMQEKMQFRYRWSCPLLRFEHV
jgi:hypothetical protein